MRISSPSSKSEGKSGIRCVWEIQQTHSSSVIVVRNDGWYSVQPLNVKTFLFWSDLWPTALVYIRRRLLDCVFFLQGFPFVKHKSLYIIEVLPQQSFLNRIHQQLHGEKAMKLICNYKMTRLWTQEFLSPSQCFTVNVCLRWVFVILRPKLNFHFKKKILHECNKMGSQLNLPSKWRCNFRWRFLHLLCTF